MANFKRNACLSCSKQDLSQDIWFYLFVLFLDSEMSKNYSSAFCVTTNI